MEFIVYYKPECPFCQKTFALLDTLNMKVEKLNVHRRGGLKNVITTLRNNNVNIRDHKTVPIIFVKVEKQIRFIGGHSDLLQFLK